MCRKHRESLHRDPLEGVETGHVNAIKAVLRFLFSRLGESFLSLFVLLFVQGRGIFLLVTLTHACVHSSPLLAVRGPQVAGQGAQPAR